MRGVGVWEGKGGFYFNLKNKIPVGKHFVYLKCIYNICKYMTMYIQ